MMSKETGVQPVGGADTIRTSVLMKRLGGILDDVCSRLADVQAVVSDYVGTGQLDHNQMERLQSLDALTQEVEAVRTVLEQVEHAALETGNPCYGLGVVLDRVRLSQIRDMLSHGQIVARQEERGNFTLF
ncbi:hypothetical protein J3T99_08485 [Acetobacteraceae bacterium B3987]|nr:hypothetical protein [Acetobacteraceae bacterium B3987]